jgi:hypothetical protein
MTTRRCCNCNHWWVTNAPPTCRTITNVCPDCIPKLFPHKPEDHGYTIHKAIA